MVQRYEIHAEPLVPSVSYDEVDEASAESMDASDPPARGLSRVGEPMRPCDPIPVRSVPASDPTPVIRPEDSPRPGT